MAIVTVLGYESDGDGLGVGADGGWDLCALRQMAAGSVRFLASGQWVFG
jgi:hypothetical protein